MSLKTNNFSQFQKGTHFHEQKQTAKCKTSRSWSKIPYTIREQHQHYKHWNMNQTSHKNDINLFLRVSFSYFSFCEYFVSKMCGFAYEI